MTQKTPEQTPPPPVTELLDPQNNKTDEPDLLTIAQKNKKAADDLLTANENIFAQYSKPEDRAVLGEGPKRGEGVTREGDKQDVPDMTPKRGLPDDDNLAHAK